MSSIAVIGVGYVGLVTGACFSAMGHDVTCCDIDESKIESLRSGRIPIYEAGLEQIVRESMAAGQLRFTNDSAAAVADVEFVYLCVPTPQTADGAADLSYLETAAAQVGPALRSGAIVVNKSTVPVGSTRLVERVVGRSDIFVVSNPEFLREGSAVQDFTHPDRVVIGSDDHTAAIRVASLYLSLATNIMITDPASAETIKYAANAFLATKLSFVNAVAAVCEAVGADVNDVVLGMGYDRRIGQDFLKPGPGWGGSCFPKDTRAMVRIAEDAGYDFSLLRGVIDVNDEQFDRVTQKVVRAAGGSVDGKAIALLGLAFKAGTDDIRESPAIAVADRLHELGAIVRAYDPAARVGPQSHIEQHQDAYGACADAAVIVLLTEWDEFKWLDYDKIGELAANRTIVDTRNVLDRAALLRRGFSYDAIGKS